MYYFPCKPLTPTNGLKRQASSHLLLILHVNVEVVILLASAHEGSSQRQCPTGRTVGSKRLSPLFFKQYLSSVVPYDDIIEITQLSWLLVNKI